MIKFLKHEITTMRVQYVTYIIYTIGWLKHYVTITKTTLYIYIKSLLFFPSTLEKRKRLRRWQSGHSMEGVSSMTWVWIPPELDHLLSNHWVAKETYMILLNPIFYYECIEDLRERHEPPQASLKIYCTNH